MKKGILTYIIYTLFIPSTIITLFIVYKNIDNAFSFKFIISYVIFLLSSFLYFIIVTLLNIKKMKWFAIRKRLFKFATLFISLSTVTYIFNYIFRPSEIDIYHFGTPLGISLSLVFFDLMFSKEKKD
jgi:hypothetical protein